MKVGELKEYLNNFGDEEEVSLIIANPKERTAYDCSNVFFITDAGMPCACVEICGSWDMDEGNAKFCEEGE